MSIEKLAQIISTKNELASVSVVADVNFGHTYPQITFPIGGQVRMKVDEMGTKIEIIKH